MTSRFRTFSLLLTLLLLFSMIGSPVTARDAEQRVEFERPILVVNTSFLNVRSGPGVENSVLVTVVGGTELPVLGVAADQVWYQVATDGGPGWVNIEFTLPRGDFSNVPLVTAAEATSSGQGGGATGTTFSLPAGQLYTGATFNGGDLFNAPDYDALKIRSGMAAMPNTVYPLLAETQNNGFQWYQIFIPNVGNVWTDQVTLRPLACGTRVGFLTAPQPIRFDSIANRDSYLLPVGSEFYILGVTDIIPNHFRVQLVDGTVGLIPSESVADIDATFICEGVPAGAASPGQGGGAVSSQATGNRVVVNTGNLNIRSGPGGNFAIVTTLSGGTEVPVLGRTASGEWYLVETTAGRGWVDKDFVVFRGAYDAVTVVNQSDGVAEGPAVTSGNRVIVNTGNLNVRSGPAAGFSVVATVPGGTTLNVVGRAPDNIWYLVEGSFGRGWLNSQFTIFRGVYDAVPVVDDTVAVPNPGSTGQTVGTRVSSGRQITGVIFVGGDLFQQPDHNSLKLRSALPAQPDTVYPLLEQRDINGVQWYLINYPGVGLAWTDRIELRLLACGTDQVGVLQEQAPIRFDGIANRDAFLLQPETEFYIVGRRDQSAIVQLQDGTTGLVLAELVTTRSDAVRSVCQNVPASTGSGQLIGSTSPTTTDTTTQQSEVASGNRVVINTGNLNVRSGPSAGFSVVTTVAGGSTLDVVGRAPDGVWYLVEGVFGRGWLNSEFVIFRGNYASVPVVDF